MDPDLSALASAVGGTLVSARPLAGGVSARVLGLDVALPGGSVRRVVWRQSTKAPTPEAAHEAAEREFALLSWLHASGFPVAPQLRFWPNPPGVLSEWVATEPAPTPPRRVAEQMAWLLGRIHAAPLADIPALPDLEDPVAHLPQFLAADHPLQAWLRAPPAPRPARRTLVHGDYWPGNLLWRHGAIAALLDWEDARFGDPHADVACARLELRYPYDLRTAEEFTKTYAALTPIDFGALAVWDAYVAAAALSAMGGWGLPPEREARMRAEATDSLSVATAAILN